MYECNTTKEFSALFSAQKFVPEALKRMGQEKVKYFSGPFKTLVASILDSKGHMACAHTNPVTKQTVTFQSHKELDKYIDDLLVNIRDKYNAENNHASVVKAFTKNHEKEFALLKALDDAFWLRHEIAVKQNQENVDVVKPVSCPFEKI